MINKHIAFETLSKQRGLAWVKAEDFSFNGGICFRPNIPERDFKDLIIYFTQMPMILELYMKYTAWHLSFIQ